jgi:hypothetical protein
LIKEKAITSREALAELWLAIGELMPYPCDPDLSDVSAINICPMPSNCRAGGESKRQSILIRFGPRGLGMYQCSSDVMRQRVRDDVVYVVTMMLRAYNLRLHSSRTKGGPFVIDCELVLRPQ